MEDKKDTLKIVHVVHWSRSGITELLRNTESFNSGKKSALVLLNNDEEFDSYFKLFSPKIQLRWNHNKLIAIARFILFIRDFNPKIIHCHSFTPLFFAVLFARKRPVFLTIHSNYDYFIKKDLKSLVKRFFLRKLSNNPRVFFIAVSGAVAESLEHLGVCDVEVWPNAISDTQYQKKGVWDNGEEMRLCMVSRLDPQKNIDSVIKAVYEFNRSKHRKRIILDIYGLGEQYGLLWDLINERGLGNSVFLMGYTNSVDRKLINYDFYVSASTSEAFGLSSLEACRGGVPVITTNQGEVANKLWDNNACIKIEGFNEDAILQALERAFIMANDLVTDMAKKAREIYLDNYTLEVYARKSHVRYSDYA